jgi:hypothetical protein
MIAPWALPFAPPYNIRFIIPGGPAVRRSQRVSAVWRATSRKAREVAHPQLFRPMLKDKPALYFPVRVAHPPDRTLI